MPGHGLNPSCLFTERDLRHGQVGRETDARDSPDLHRLVLTPRGQQPVVVGREGKVGDEGGVPVDPWDCRLVRATLCLQRQNGEAVEADVRCLARLKS